MLKRQRKEQHFSKRVPQHIFVLSTNCCRRQFSLLSLSFLWTGCNLKSENLNVKYTVGPIFGFNRAGKPARVSVFPWPPVVFRAMVLDSCAWGGLAHIWSHRSEPWEAKRSSDDPSSRWLYLSLPRRSLTFFFEEKTDWVTHPRPHQPLSVVPRFNDYYYRERVG